MVDFRRMNKILRVDKTAETVRVQAGTTLGEVNRRLGKHGLFLAHDPWTRDYATVGGAISTNGIGYYAGKYGTMGDQVLGLTAVLGDGTVVETPGIPNSTVGLDLKRLVIGTEGTIGLITEATLRCHPKPETQKILAYRFSAFKNAFEAALKLREVGVDSTSMDVISDGDKETCEFYLVLTGFRRLVDELERKSKRVLGSKGGKSLGPNAGQAYWKHRHDIATKYERSIAKSPLAHWRGEKTFDFLHVGLPVGSVLKYKQGILNIAKRHRLTVESYGLWIKPELFQTTFSRDENRGGAAPEAESLEGTVREGLNLAIRLGGAFEYCHGVGFRLDGYMDAQHGPALETMRKVKAALDSKMILNPGKLALHAEKRGGQGRLGPSL